MQCAGCWGGAQLVRRAIWKEGAARPPSDPDPVWPGTQPHLPTNASRTVSSHTSQDRVRLRVLIVHALSTLGSPCAQAGVGGSWAQPAGAGSAPHLRHAPVVCVGHQNVHQAAEAARELRPRDRGRGDTLSQLCKRVLLLLAPREGGFHLTCVRSTPPGHGPCATALARRRRALRRRRVARRGRGGSGRAEEAKPSEGAGGFGDGSLAAAALVWIGLRLPVGPVGSRCLHHVVLPLRLHIGRVALDVELGRLHVVGQRCAGVGVRPRRRCALSRAHALQRCSADKPSGSGHSRTSSISSPRS